MEVGKWWRLGSSRGWGAVEAGEQWRLEAVEAGERWRLGSCDFVHRNFGWSLSGTWNCLLGRGASEFTREEWS